MKPSDLRPESPLWLGTIAAAVVEAANEAGIGVVVAFLEPKGVDATYAYVSDSMRAMLGDPSNEVFARSPLSFVAPRDLPKMQERLERRRQGDEVPIHYTLTLLHKDGSEIPVEVAASTVEIAGRKALVTFIVDLTDRVEARAKQERSEQSLRAVIELAPEPIAIWKAGRFVYANPAHAKLLGYESGDGILGRPVTETVHHDDAPAVVELSETLASTSDSCPPRTFRFRKVDGTTVHVEVSALGFDYEGQRAVMVLGRDVTTRRALEAQLLQADRLAALGTMAAGVAHEVNNPLAYVLLNLEWIAKKLPETVPSGAQLHSILGLVEEARAGAERVAGIVRDLKAFARADEETKKVVSLATVIRSAIRLVSHDVRHRARVITELADVAPIFGNEARLEQVLLNLLLNAAQALPDGDPSRNVIRVVLSGDDLGACIHVEDNGAGMSTETMRRIFDPFFTTKPVGIGTGLGLSICHTIVTAHGGRISVKSVEGEGSVFSLELPFYRGEVEKLEATAPSRPSAPRGRARVLIVDDEAAIARTMKELLEFEHDIVTLAGAREAIELFERDARFDVILCDLMMPDMSGMDLYERLARERPELAEKMVFMTGGAFTARAADFLARTKNIRLEKPFSLTKVEETLALALARGGP